MSTDLQTHLGSPFEPHHETHEHAHPSDKLYIVTALILAVITAAEVATYFIEGFGDLNTGAQIAILFPMMIAKFVVVCGWFMHLKYDNPIFRRIFVFGLVLAVCVYMVALTSLHLFGDAA